MRLGHLVQFLATGFVLAVLPACANSQDSALLGAMLGAAANSPNLTPNQAGALATMGAAGSSYGNAQASRSSTTVNVGGSGAQQGRTMTVSDFELPGGRRYTGQLLELGGRRGPHGHGVMRWSDGETLEGEWVFRGETYDFTDGRAVWTSPDGEKYDGEWRDGKYNGRGVWTSPKGGRTEGQWRDGKPWKTSGLSVYPDGVRQSGNWDNETMRGSGIIEWPGGQRYEGSWKVKDGQLDDPDGEGVMTWPDGRRYVGEFKDGKFSGRGRMTYADSRVEDGSWSAGEFMGGASTPKSTPVPASGTGEVTVSCDIEGCEVFVDNEFVGNTPAKLKLPAGSHAISVRKSGHKEFTREIKVGAGSELTLKAVMEPL